MARLDIVVHQGCLSEQTVSPLARDLQEALPGWRIQMRAADTVDTEQLGLLTFPTFLVNGRVVATGIPRKEWLMSTLETWEHRQG